MDDNSPLFHVFNVPKSRIKRTVMLQVPWASVHDQYVMLFIENYECVITTYGTEQMWLLIVEDDFKDILK